MPLFDDRERAETPEILWGLGAIGQFCLSTNCQLSQWGKMMGIDMGKTYTHVRLVEQPLWIRD